MTTETMGAHGDLRKRFGTAGWGLLLLWSGALVMLPGEPGMLWHVWLIGVGAILLGVSVVVRAVGLKPSWDTIVLGIVALVSGIGGFAGASFSAIGLALILFGLALVITATRTWWATTDS
jgi:uncharacterized membrane protein YtjA (UPF0391 family)